MHAEAKVVKDLPTNTFEQGRPFLKQFRLLKPAEFKYVFAEPVRVSGKYLTILYRKNTLAHPRLGLVISGKRVASSVARNRLKRLIRESFRLHTPALPAVDIVVLAKSQAADAKNQEIRQCLEHLWQKLRG